MAAEPTLDTRTAWTQVKEAAHTRLKHLIAHATVFTTEELITNDMVKTIRKTETYWNATDQRVRDTITIAMKDILKRERNNIRYAYNRTKDHTLRAGRRILYFTPNANGAELEKMTAKYVATIKQRSRYAYVPLRISSKNAANWLAKQEREAAEAAKNSTPLPTVTTTPAPATPAAPALTADDFVTIPRALLIDARASIMTQLITLHDIPCDSYGAWKRVSLLEERLKDLSERMTTELRK